MCASVAVGFLKEMCESFPEIQIGRDRHDDITQISRGPIYEFLESSPLFTFVG
jgi:hypothetical protein